MAQSRDTVSVTASSEREIVITREFNAPRHLVFDAWTKCEHLRHWWGPRSWSLPVCEIDLRVGGAWRFLMCGEGGEEMGMYGEYLEIVVPERIVQTENFEGEMFEAMGGGTINTLVLTEEKGRTTLTSTALYKSREARDAVMQFPMEDGLKETFEQLDELLATIPR